MDIIRQLAQELSIRPAQAEAAVKLIDEGNTIPFIARYRKEATGSLNDEVLRKLLERLNYLRNLEEKKEQVMTTIEEQGKLTPELKKQILEAQTLVAVEDLYRPYRPKRRTRATIAKERGLEPLANVIALQMTSNSLIDEAAPYVSEEKNVSTAADAIAGAQDILAERISDEADYRTRIREMTMRDGWLVSEAKDDTAQSVYEAYYHYEEPISKIAGHRILAINRGEKEKFLTVKIDAPEDRILQYLERKVITRNNPNTAPALKDAIQDTYRRLIAPAIERETRNSLTEKAEDGAISVFGKNLTSHLYTSPR
ncbi:MAG: RNA-binding transcriptional accessory protein, partial [Clostridiales bacterium]|nr:RNA-binding transcriptional accessory protein [Clostridiales bacterium]